MSDLDTIQSAARALRAHQLRSQQSMATALGLSMGALRNYESGAVTKPEPRPLYAYMRQAIGSGRDDLAAVFRRALNETLGIPDDWRGQLGVEPLSSFESVMVTAMLMSVRRRPPFEKFQKQVFRALEEPCRLLAKGLSQTKAEKEAFRAIVAQLSSVTKEGKQQ
jgi:hypothetical protein